MSDEGFVRLAVWLAGLIFGALGVLGGWTAVLAGSFAFGAILAIGAVQR